MTPSASSDHLTSESHHPTKWELPTLSWCGIFTMGLGILVLFGVFLKGHDSPSMSMLSVAYLALAVTLILGGMQAIRWGVGSRKDQVREEMFVKDLVAIEANQNALTDSLDKFVTTETAQADRSREARERLERMERSLIAIDAKLADAEVFGQHLVTLADRMEALEKRQEELLNLMVARTTSESVDQRATRPPSAPRPRRSRKRAQPQPQGEGSNVVPIRARRAADALRRLTEQITDEPNA